MSASPLTDEVPAWLRDYLAMEESATEIRAHSPYLVFGLFQIPDYAAAVARSVGVTQPDDDYVERTVALRAIRQRRIHSGELPVTVVQSEFALRLRMNTNTTMAAQLAHLAELADWQNVTIQIAPYTVGLYEALRIGSYTLLPRGGQPNLAVHLEGHDGGRLIEDVDQTAHFEAAFEQAQKIALSPAESRQFLLNVGQEWEREND